MRSAFHCFRPYAATSLLLFFSLFLFGCPQTPVVEAPEVADPAQAFAQHQQSLTTLSHWQVRGKVAIKTAEESNTANLNWQLAGADYKLMLTSFIGTSLMELEGDKYQAVLKVDGETYHSRAPERLIYQTTGWRLPVSTLPDWILGRLSQPNAKHVLDSSGKLASQSLQTDDGLLWQIDYREYQQAGGHWLPRKMTIHGPEITIKLVISKWELQDQ
ncbi:MULTISPECIES: lipoprotein insertase outer membrane protein LolB [Corallincola]|uniref:Outer-membrane lipoprotein LolB n=2 Tax=Corallincola TaxID=1775176 RepID=A0A368NF44_9GAMM|nr:MULTISPECIES: lipoprotein insertase outer membrane protein LolB [Corallincola]RCU48836.1 outer membrane lipoprotein LolB [Corallincola holothuriorum]TAA43730.1 outer membrane lipoprotein LolB [Corallincola spongiicola]